MADLVLHGLETIEGSSGPRPVQTIDTGVIGLVGTAPEANATLWPLNTPVPIYGSSTIQGLGSAGTLMDALEGIFDQAGKVSQTVVVVRVAQGATMNETLQNVMGSSTTMTGIHALKTAPSELGLKPKLLVAPGFTSYRPTDALATTTVGTPGTGYVDPPAVTISGGGGYGAKAVATVARGVNTIAVGTGGTGYTAAPTVVISAPESGGVQATATATVAAGVITAIAVTNPGSGYTTPPTVSFTGVGTGGTATATVTGRVSGLVITNHGAGYATAPTIAIAAPPSGTTALATSTIGTAGNPVTSEFLSIAAFFRAGVIKDGTATTTSAAISDRMDYDSDRLLIVEPMVKVFKNAQVVNEPGSARVAGLQAYVDYTEGFWFSPSNHVVNGVIGISRPIGHSISDPSAESQLLNRNEIAAFVRSPSGGYKLWGNRVASSDTLKAFWSVRRAHDTIIDSVELACEPFIDKPYGLQVLVDDR